MPLTHRRFLAFALLAALSAALLFALGLGGGFMLDDAHTITRNPLIQINTLNLNQLLYAASSFHAGNSLRPLAMLSFALDYWRQGSLDAASFKATNLAIHALTCFGMALFLRRLLLLAGWSAQRAATAALVLALLWAIHPLQVSAVLYVVQRMQTMATLFLVWALWAYLGLRQAQMEGRRALPQGLAALGFWLLALASKEDAVLLPAYTLVLELTVLRFRAQQDWRAHSLRRSYLLMTLAGAAVFLFWALPHYWNWDAYAGRDYSTVERLLTQPRVLLMYLGQILLPWPGNMPFNYDQLAISRSLFHPLTTLPALVGVIGLLAWAWYWRNRRPLFALGVLLFFAGHFITSNVVSLELAFEHRNHFPLIGALLALTDLFVIACQRWQPAPRMTAAIILCGIAATAAAGGMRAHLWGEPARLAEYHVQIAPESARAWLTLGGIHFDRYKTDKDTAHLDRAITTVEQAANTTGSISAYSNIVTYKTIRGTVTPADWNIFLRKLEAAPMLAANKNILWPTINNVRTGIALDEERVLQLIEIITQRASFQPQQDIQIGVFIYLHTKKPELALQHFIRGAERLPADYPAVLGLQRDLRSAGKPEWADKLAQAAGTHASR